MIDLPQSIRDIQEAAQGKPLRAFHGSQELKDFYLARVRAHREADELVHGQYWQEGKGCAVGCTIHGSQHASYETKLGIPMVLARLEDGIFEGLGNGDAQAWPERFLSAPPIGADLSMVWPKFAHWLLVDDPDDGVIRFAKSDRVRQAIEGVAELYRQWIAGNKPTREEWLNKRRIAVAAYAADAAAYAADAAAYAADAAAYADAYAAANAAYAAYAADAAAYAAYAAADAAYAADAASRRAVRLKQAAKLEQLMREAV